MTKVRCLGINDREIRPYKMDYVPESVPQYCILRRKLGAEFRIIVNPNHLFFMRGRLFKVIPKTTPTFIFNMMNRESLRLIQDESGKDIENTWFLGRSCDLHDKESAAISAQTANVLDHLVQPAFWMGLRRQLKLSRMELLIIAGAGVGAWEIIRNLIGMFAK